MKYKTKKMWKPWILFVLIFTAYFLIPTGFAYFKTKEATKKRTIITDDVKLKNIGYSLNDISIITKNKKYKKYALNKKYDSTLMDYIKIKDFNIDLINEYKKYKIENKNANLEDIVKIINLGINQKYDEKLSQLINSKYFIKKRVNRYLDYTLSNDVNVIIRQVNSDRDRDFYTKTVQTNINKKILMLVNKYHYLNDSYTGLNLVNVDYSYGNGQLNSETYEAFKKLNEDAKNQGLNIIIQSSFRNFQSQVVSYNDCINNNGQTWADLLSAKAGYSEHQTGLAIDLKTYSTYNLEDFLYTNEFNWMQDNAYKYGFILRYPENKTDITGYNFEPWHYRYVGVDAAKTIHDENITFEEYYAYYVEKEDK